jgi:hypothetical protein
LYSKKVKKSLLFTQLINGRIDFDESKKHHVKEKKMVRMFGEK